MALIKNATLTYKKVALIFRPVFRSNRKDVFQINKKNLTHKLRRQKLPPYANFFHPKLLPENWLFFEFMLFLNVPFFSLPTTR